MSCVKDSKLVRINKINTNLFIILIVAECLGDYCFHYSISHKHMKNSVYCAGVLFYVFIGLIYFQILKRYDNLAVPNAIYQCLSVLAVTLSIP